MGVLTRSPHRSDRPHIGDEENEYRVTRSSHAEERKALEPVSKNAMNTQHSSTLELKRTFQFKSNDNDKENIEGVWKRLYRGKLWKHGQPTHTKKIESKRKVGEQDNRKYIEERKRSDINRYIDEIHKESTHGESSSGSSESSNRPSDATTTPMSPKWDAKIERELESVVYKFYREEPDPEDEDTWDVSMVAEYSPEIFNYMRDLETKYSPYPYYIPEVQSEITWDNRATLINWIVQVHSRFNLLPETLYLTVNLIDRFLSKRPISLSKFQLCGAVALFIAAKYEEINCPTVKQMAYMVSNQYTTKELLKAERFMISDLEFNMGYPGPMSFLRRTSKADNYDSEIRTLAKYFLEITIMDMRFVSSPPSWLAAGASYLSLKMLRQEPWTEAHVYYSGYTEEQLAPLAEVMLECCLDYKTHHKAIFDKYSSRKYKRSSLFVQEYLKRELNEH